MHTCISHTKTESDYTQGIYDAPKTPCEHVLGSNAVTVQIEQNLTQTPAELNEAEIFRNIKPLKIIIIQSAKYPVLVEYLAKLGVTVCPIHN